ncbi:60S ribosomal protein L13a-like [Drosophila miranda]|uniref:60S ribosomal protein L13a-like n=1 Tax=Drosophila miranda TaxID=7229 RepID=UPI00143F250F|nr:60S ribosomal protein L13a-like [Drosophila miranda]
MTFPCGSTNRTVVIDGRGHLLVRLASVVAKYLLQGGKVAVVRCEELNLSGHFYRNKIKFLAYLRKRCNVNPARGPFHVRATSRIFYKAVRGMIPHKTDRKYCQVGRLSHEVGWHYQDVIKSLERNRKLCVTLKHNRELKKLTLQAQENIAKAAEPFNKIIQEMRWS